MKKKILILILTAVVLFVSLIFGKGYNMTNNLNQKGEKISLVSEINNDLSLTIYYMPLGVFTLYPYSEQDIINGHYYFKTDISNIALKDYMTYLEQIDKVKLEKVNNKDSMNLRIYGEFTSKRGKVYSFGLSGYKGTMVVNGKLYNQDIIFYKFVSNFVPYCEIENFNDRTKSM